MLVNGASAPLYVISPTQINFQIPFSVVPGQVVQVVVVRNGVASTPQSVRVELFAPAIFENPNTGEPFLTRNSTGQTITSSNRAQPNDVLVVWFTGLGGVTNRPGSGQIAATQPLSVSMQPTAARLGGVDLVTFPAVLAPNFIGLGQAAVQLPGLLPPAPDGTLEFAFLVGGFAAPAVDLPVEGGDPPTSPPAGELLIEIHGILPESPIATDSLTMEFTIHNSANLAGEYDAEILFSNAPVTDADGAEVLGIFQFGIDGGPSFRGFGIRMPDGIAPGTYHLALLLSPSPGKAAPHGDPVLSNSFEFTVLENRLPFDLHVTAGSGGPVGAGPGDGVTVEYRVTGEDGDGDPLFGTFIRRFYLSPDATITETDTLLSEGIFTLIDGARDFVTAPSALPRDLPPGDYFLGVMVEPEGDTAPADNAASAPFTASDDRLPFDLGAEDPEVSTTIVQAGGTFDFTFNIFNYSASVGTYRYQIRFSSEDPVTEQDTLLAEGEITLDGDDVRLSITGITFPLGTAPGTYSVVVFLEDEADTDRVDNASEPVKITVGN